MSAANSPQHIIISQFKNIGDVVLCLPLAGLIKHHFPECKVTLLASRYTHPVAACCPAIDALIDWTDWQDKANDELVSKFKQLHASHIIHLANSKQVARLAYQAAIPYRIGTSQRLYHWRYCNLTLNQARRNSCYHELQLNAQMLGPIGIDERGDMLDLLAYMQLIPPSVELPTNVEALLATEDFKLIIHPGSNGHGREWPQAHIQTLIPQLVAKGITVFLSGTADEAERFAPLINACPEAHSLMGALNLSQFIAFISRTNGLIASGTGPVHIAAALGLLTLGLYPPRKGISPVRWSPPGINAEVKMHQRKGSCLGCRNSVGCQCMAKISAEAVEQCVKKWLQTSKKTNL